MPAGDMNNAISNVPSTIYQEGFLCKLAAGCDIPSVVEPALFAFDVAGHIVGEPLYRKPLACPCVYGNIVKPLRHERRRLPKAQHKHAGKHKGARYTTCSFYANPTLKFSSGVNKKAPP